MLKAEIYINLKKTLADPAGLTVKHALEALSYENLESVRIGKMITIKFDCSDHDKTKLEVKEMCERLLANPIIEDYTFKISEE